MRSSVTLYYINCFNWKRLVKKQKTVMSLQTGYSHFKRSKKETKM